MESLRKNFGAMVFYDYKCSLTERQCIVWLNLAFTEEAPSNKTLYS